MCSGGIGITQWQLEEVVSRYPPRGLPAEAAVVRLAPSPTGQPHIGTALQATINYALARQQDGVFILRIEDTDQKRLVPGTIDAILDALRWLGLPPDEGQDVGGSYGPYLQSERLDIYRVVADWLVAHGHAYLCFCSEDELAARREAQVAAGVPPRYDRRCRALTPAERERRYAAGTQPVVRLAMPLAGTIVFEDPVRGAISFDAAEQDDPILLKSDGYPTYHLAAMVDDHLMQVTVVVRGEEWISSTPKHLVLYQALGWQPPRIVHTPLLRDAQGRKLGKRFGDTSLAWFKTQGYLPEALRNFLTRVIWTHPDGADIYPFADFVRHITPAALPKTGPMVDLSLLDFICGEYLRRLDAAALYERMSDWLDWLLAQRQPTISFQIVEKSGRREQVVPREAVLAFQHAFTADRAYSERVLTLEPERYHKLADIALLTRFFFADLFEPPAPDLLATQTHGDRLLAHELIGQYLAAYDHSLSEATWQEAVRLLAARTALQHGAVFMLLRLALTGSDRTPPLYPIMRVLGATEVERRLSAAHLSLASPGR